MEEASGSTAVLGHDPFSPLIQQCSGSLTKNDVLDSFAFLSVCEEVADSSTFFESNQEYVFFLNPYSQE